MKKLNKKIIRVFLLAFMFLFFIAGTTYAREMEKETTTDINKVWTIRFNKSINFNTTKSGINVSNIKSNEVLKLDIVSLDEKTVQIKPPSNGYKIGETYRIIVYQSVMPCEGKGLKEQVVKEFEVKNGFKAYADVKVSDVIDIFKSINIKSTTLPEAKKYKIEGSPAVYNVGEENTIMLTNKPKITFYKSDGVTKVGEGIIDLSKTNSNVEIVCQ